MFVFDTCLMLEWMIICCIRHFLLCLDQSSTGKMAVGAAGSFQGFGNKYVWYGSCKSNSPVGTSTIAHACGSNCSLLFQTNMSTTKHNLRITIRTQKLKSSVVYVAGPLLTDECVEYHWEQKL